MTSGSIKAFIALMLAEHLAQSIFSLSIDEFDQCFVQGER
jgi:hypothetical protein